MSSRRRWQVSASWLAPGGESCGCRGGQSDSQHPQHWVARTKTFDIEDTAARWRLKVTQDPGAMLGNRRVTEVDLIGPTPFEVPDGSR